MNILLIPNNDWLNHPVPAQRHYKIFERLGRKHNVYVIQFDIFKKTEKPTHIPEYTKLIKPFTIHVSDPAQFYIANLIFQEKKIFSAIRELDIDVVFGSNLIVCTLGFEAAKRFGAKSIFDLSDFFPASVLAYYPKANRISASIIYSLATSITNHNIRIADLCTTCSTTLKEYAMQIGKDVRVEHLPNGVNTKVFAPKPPSESLKRDLELADNILIYVGSIESWLNFDLVLDAIEILKREQVKVQLMVIGRSIYSDEPNPLVQKIFEKNLEHQVTFLGYQPYETLPDFINMGIGGVIPFKTDSLLTQMAFPNKLLEYLACGKPVFAPPMRELIKVGGEYLLPYTSPRTLALQIRKAISSNYNPDEIRKSVLNYDWNIIADRLETLMQELVR
jgi:glycosyltransferase involved in cell wall biosynthesis